MLGAAGHHAGKHRVGAEDADGCKGVADDTSARDGFVVRAPGGAVVPGQPGCYEYDQGASS